MQYACASATMMFDYNITVYAVSTEHLIPINERNEPSPVRLLPVSFASP